MLQFFNYGQHVVAVGLDGTPEGGKLGRVLGEPVGVTADRGDVNDLWHSIDAGLVLDEITLLQFEDLKAKLDLVGVLRWDFAWDNLAGGWALHLQETWGKTWVKDDPIR